MTKTTKVSFRDYQKERGSILVITILLSFMTLLLATPLLTKISGQYRITNKSFRQITAFNLAEAGVERAIWELNHGTILDWEGDDESRTLMISSFQADAGTEVGDISITVLNLQGENPVIESTGRVSYIGSNDLEKYIRVVVEEIETDSLFDYGIFGKRGLEMSGNALVDSYDSREGVYGGENAGDEGQMGTNGILPGDIRLSNNVEVNGDAVVGPGAIPDEVIYLLNSATITGETTALIEEKIFPSVVPPSNLPPRGDYLVQGDATITESGMYSKLIFNSNSKISITSDCILYVTGEFTMLSNTQLEIAEGVTLALYLGGTFYQSSNSQINNLSLDPTKVQIYGTETFISEMTWESNSSFYGAIYVPDSKVLYNSNAEFYGSIIADTVKIDSNAGLHYDLALMNLGSIYTTVTSTYKIKSWQETF